MLTLGDVKKLAMISGPCVSVFEPLRDTYTQVTKAATRLSGAAQQAESLLIERGMDDAAARDRLLRPIHRIARTVKLSGHTGSVVIFRAPYFTRASFWPDPLDARVTVGDEFFVLPLLAGLAAMRTFWILALSINGIRLLRGTMEGLQEVVLPKALPHSLAEAGGFDQPDHDLEGRSAPGAATGQTAAVRFGTTSLHETKARHLHDFFRMADHAIHPLLARTGDPLILCAVSRELAIYRDINTYPALWEENIHGSPEQIGDQRLHQTALELLVAGSKTATGNRLKEIDTAAGKGLLLRDVAEIQEAARLGKVERLFVNTNSRADQEAVNSAALAVIRNSGSVVWDEGLSATPGTFGSVAAILRYRAAIAPQPATAAGTT